MGFFFSFTVILDMGHDNKTLQLVLNVVGMIVGVFIMAAGICRFIDGGHDAINIILGVYLIFFGIVLVTLELKAFAIFYRLCGFLYIFCGTLSYVGNDWTLMFPITCFVVGILWIVFSFLKIPLPHPIIGGETSDGSHNHV